MLFKKYKKLTESIQDMERRCEKCNTLLSDVGLCPKCDDGEEDYEDVTPQSDLQEECTQCTVHPFGARWFIVKDSEGKVVLQDDGAPRIFTSEESAQEFTTSYKMPLREQELTVREKLKAAYPELNFDKPLTEGVASDIITSIKQYLDEIKNKDEKTWATTLSKIIEALPNDKVDELFDKVTKSFENTKVDDNDVESILNATGTEADPEQTKDARTLGKLFAALDIANWGKKNPALIKTFLITVLTVVAAIEPTPVVEILLVILAAIPEDVVAKIISALNIVGNPVATMTHVANKVTNEELSNKEKLKRAYPELNFDEQIVHESVEETPHDDCEDCFDYDDDYEMDDVELDRRHAALYGGERMYCDCGAKLAFDEYGSYCPECEPKEFE